MILVRQREATRRASCFRPLVAKKLVAREIAAFSSEYCSKKQSEEEIFGFTEKTILQKIHRRCETMGNHAVKQASLNIEGLLARTTSQVVPRTRGTLTCSYCRRIGEATEFTVCQAGEEAFAYCPPSRRCQEFHEPIRAAVAMAFAAKESAPDETAAQSLRLWEKEIGSAIELWKQQRMDEVDELICNLPDFAYALIQKALIVAPLTDRQAGCVLPYEATEERATHQLLRVVCISDTHSLHSQFPKDFLPPGDILIHSGDFSNVGRYSEIKEFLEWFGSQTQYKHRILIAGNHDLGLHAESYPKTQPRFQRRAKPDDPAECRALLTSDKFIYLEDSEVTVEGLRIYGMPWQPTFYDWAYNLDRGAPIREYIDKIPSDVDILISHGPPLGYGDRCSGGNRAGCLDLLKQVNQRIRPRAHIFGHIHEAYGLETNGHTLFVNPSTCTYQYRPTNPPICFDIARTI